MIVLRCEAVRPSGPCADTTSGVTRDTAIAFARAQGWQVPAAHAPGTTYCAICARLIRGGKLPQRRARPDAQTPFSGPDAAAGAVEEAAAIVGASAALEAPDAALWESLALAVSPEIAWQRVEAGCCPWCGGPGEVSTTRLGDLSRAAKGLPPLERPLEESSWPDMSCCCGTCYWRRKPTHDANGACTDCPIRIRVGKENL